MIEFFITKGRLEANGDLIDVFETEADAANFAIRHAQNNGLLYRIFYC